MVTKPKLLELITEEDFKDVDLFKYLLNSDAGIAILLAHEDKLRFLPDGFFEGVSHADLVKRPQACLLFRNQRHLINKFPIAHQKFIRQQLNNNLSLSLNDEVKAVHNNETSSQEPGIKKSRITNTIALIKALEAIRKKFPVNHYCDYFLKVAIEFLTKNSKEDLGYCLNTIFDYRQTPEAQSKYQFPSTFRGNVLSLFFHGQFAQLIFTAYPNLLDYISSEGLNAKVSMFGLVSYAFNYLFFESNLTVYGLKPALGKLIDPAKIHHPVALFAFNSTDYVMVKHSTFFTDHPEFLPALPDYMHLRINAIHEATNATVTTSATSSKSSKKRKNKKKVIKNVVTTETQAADQENALSEANVTEEPVPVALQIAEQESASAQSSATMPEAVEEGIAESVIDYFVQAMEQAKLQQYLEALTLLKNIPNWHADKKLFPLIKECIAKFDDIKLVEKLSEEPLSYGLKSHLASFCMEKEWFLLTKNILEPLLNSEGKDKSKRKMLIECYFALSDVSSVITLCEASLKLKEFQNDSYFLKQIVRALEVQMNFEKALTILQQVKNWRQDPELAVKAAHYQFMLGRHLDAEQSFSGCLKQFPKDEKVYLHYVKFLRMTKPENLMAAIAKGVKLFPSIRVELDKVAILYSQAEDLPKAILLTRNLIANDATNAEYHLNLLRLLRLAGNLEDVNAIAATCKTLFADKPDVLTAVECLLQAPTILLIKWCRLSNDEPFVIEAEKRVSEILISFENDEGEVLAVGSRTTLGVIKKAAQESDFKLVCSDYDFISSVTNPIAYSNKHFQKCLNHPFTEEGVDLYKLDLRGHMDMSVYTNRQKFLERLQTRQFLTIFYLFRDKNNCVHDISGLGIFDAQHGLLRPYGNPVKLLEQDPVRILRVIRYMAEGGRIEQSLEKALHKCEFKRQGDIEHFKALLSQYFYFRKSDQAFFFEKLQKYLGTPKLEKLLGIKFAEKDSKACADQLAEHFRLEALAKRKQQQPARFFRTEDSALQATSSSVAQGVEASLRSS